MEIIKIFLIIAWFGNIIGLDNFLSTNKQTENRELQFYETINIPVNSSHIQHNHSEKVLNIIYGENYTISSIQLDDPTFIFNFQNHTEEYSSFVKEENDYFSSEIAKVKENYKNVKNILYNKSNSNINIFKGTWKLKGPSNLPFINAVSGEFYFMMEFMKLLNLQGQLFYLIDVQFKLYGSDDDLPLNTFKSKKKFNKDSYLLVRKLSSQKILFSDIIHRENNSFEIKNFKSVITEVSILDFINYQCKS